MESGSFSTADSYFDDSERNFKNYYLREIKQMLLSGNKEEITTAVSRILTQMKDDERIMEMINSDVSEFLCDAMLPFDCFISGTIYTCLGIMSKYEHFYSQNHSSIAMETIIRSMHFLIKDSGLESGIGLPLDTLVQIVQGYVEFQVLPEKKPFENLLNLTFNLLKKNQISEEVKCQTCIILTALFQMGLHKPALEICDRWLDIICERSENSDTSDEIIYLGCMLTDKALRQLASNGIAQGQLLTDLDDGSESEVQSNIIRNIIIFLIDIIAPSIGVRATIGISFSRNEKRQIVKLEYFFMSLNVLFKNSFPQSYQVAQRLSEMGFIHILTNILIYTHANRHEKLADVCVSVLFEIVLSLSDDVFLFPEMWKSGRDHFRREILKGMSFLSADATTWIDILTCGEVDYSSKLALVVYFYFYYLTMNSSPNNHIIYPSATGLVKLSDAMGSSALLNKILWFIFVVSQMSANTESPRSCHIAITKMLEILESQTDLSLMYTHHPAILYWSFSSSRISCRIQCEVVKLWLEIRSPDCTVLDDLVKKSEDVRVAIFQLLQNGHEYVAQPAFSTLKNFLQHSQDDSLSCNVWFTLPQALAKYTTDTFSAMKVDYMLELATIKVPEVPDMNKVIRIATLLPEVMEISNLISFTSAAKLTLQVLELAVRYDESRVLLSLLRCNGFIQKIVSAIAVEPSELVLVSLRVIVILWNIDLNPSHLAKQMVLDPHILQKIFNSDDIELIKVGLELTEQILSRKFKSSLIQVPGVSPEFVRNLFFDLENVLVRCFPLISGLPWRCLKQCLLVDDEKFLAQDCLLHEVVSYGLPYLNETPDMVDFLMVWMARMQEIQQFCITSRRIRQSFFLDTVRAVAVFLAENFVQDSAELCRTVLDCWNHFSADIHTEPFKKLQSKCYYPVGFN